MDTLIHVVMFLCAFYEAHKNIKAVSYNKERNKLGVEIKI